MNRLGPVSYQNFNLVQFKPSPQPLAQSWLRLRNWKSRRGSWSTFRYFLLVLFLYFFPTHSVTACSLRVGAGGSGQAKGGKGLQWLEWAYCGFGALWVWPASKCLSFYGMIWGFVGDGHWRERAWPLQHTLLLTVGDVHTQTRLPSPCQRPQPIPGGLLGNSSSLAKGPHRVTGNTHLCRTVEDVWLLPRGPQSQLCHRLWP